MQLMKKNLDLDRMGLVTSLHLLALYKVGALDVDMPITRDYVKFSYK